MLPRNFGSKKAGDGVVSWGRGLVLALVHFDATTMSKEAIMSNGTILQGILWLVCVIPAILLLLAIWIISKYELSDEKMDEINKAIEEKNA